MTKKNSKFDPTPQIVDQYEPRWFDEEILECEFSKLQTKIAELIDKYGPDARFNLDAGCNNISVTIIYRGPETKEQVKLRKSIFDRLAKLEGADFKLYQKLKKKFEVK